VARSSELGSLSLSLSGRRPPTFPSPLVGEGKGEGEHTLILACYRQRDKTIN